MGASDSHAKIPNPLSESKLTTSPRRRDTLHGDTGVTGFLPRCSGPTCQHRGNLHLLPKREVGNSTTSCSPDGAKQDDGFVVASPASLALPSTHRQRAYFQHALQYELRRTKEQKLSPPPSGGEGRIQSSVCHSTASCCHRCWCHAGHQAPDNFTHHMCGNREAPRAQCWRSSHCLQISRATGREKQQNNIHE